MEERTPDTVKGKSNGGLYAKVKMSLKTANILVAVLVVALVLEIGRAHV